ncbi:TetR family transcriptional regulator [Mesorhizobium sp. L-8-10]|uniref:TetR/AcrR family transcriptional regulator n=1 Tax=Mesorhizobium sp. L-8-10 TaxID=2744523 RepID=UPI00192766FF|nr:TetR/AcrR family transcriptional regulator [Mesorhizobium sp. L-8-10]BCH35717.1 TetR family transcriptional regulator [Mesorhizobium sp. L-8-10]
MARLTREQSQALTREGLLLAASEIVSRDSYSGVTIERIAEEAGFSKGAFYSNFANKEEIFLQLLELHAGRAVVELTDRLEGIEDPEHAIDSLCGWATQRAKDKRWGALAVDLLTIARREDALEDRHLRLFRDQWEGLGRLLSRKLFPGYSCDLEPLYVGGIVMELIYGGISSFMGEETPGDMLRAALTSMRQAHLHRQAG